ncbi:MAG: hypothetical protein JSV25_08480 [Spirochaetota bacterium]|nr:MAG: hypothetical protein JSV25_08480 [Spirochaetota bacterium]
MTDDEKRDIEDNETIEQPVKFHYDRERRLEKLKRLRRDIPKTPKRRRFFAKKRTRSLLIILIDLILIAAAYYLLTRPANVYLEKEGEGLLYELNINGIRGKRVLIGFTVTSLSEDTIVFSEPVIVTVKLTDRNNNVLTYQRTIESGTILRPDESSSVAFLLAEDELPGSCVLDIYYGNSTLPLFTRNVRF